MDADKLQPRLTAGDIDEDRAELGLTGERGTGESREAHVEGETQDQPQHAAAFPSTSSAAHVSAKVSEKRNASAVMRPRLNPACSAP